MIAITVTEHLYETNYEGDQKVVILTNVAASKPKKFCILKFIKMA